MCSVCEVCTCVWDVRCACVYKLCEVCTYMCSVCEVCVDEVEGVVWEEEGVWLIGGRERVI